MTSISSELSRILKIEYLESLSSSDLAFWLINSFSPERYRDPSDVIEYACRLIYQQSQSPLIVTEFLDRLWGMFGLEPDYAPNIYMHNVVNFRKAA